MINKLSSILKNILDLPISLYFNFYYLPFKHAIKMPIVVSHKIKIISMGKRENVKIRNLKFGSIKIGRNSSFDLGNSDRVYWNIDKNAKIEFEGRANIGKGTQIICSSNGTIFFGDDFYCNALCIINSSGNITFGKNTLIGWKTEFLTSGGHKIYKKNKDESKDIIIGNHVWIASNVTILNGCSVGENSVIATKAFVNKKFKENNILIGNFNKILQENINWEK